MSQNSSSKLAGLGNTIPTRFKKRWVIATVVVIWVALSFFVGELVAALIAFMLHNFGVDASALDSPLSNTLFSLIVYAVCLTMVFIVPWTIARYRSTTEDVGLTRLPEWFDFLMAPAGAVVYFIISGALVYLATILFPSFNATQAQDVGFAHLSNGFQYLLAFLSLVVIAPLSEELIFRGFLLGKLRRVVPLWVAILITSIVFGALHGQLNVSLDTFSLSIILCLLRVYTKSIWASVLLHMIKNAIAFYILFINPS